MFFRVLSHQNWTVRSTVTIKDPDELEKIENNLKIYVPMKNLKIILARFREVNDLYLSIRDTILLTSTSSFVDTNITKP